MSRRLKRTMSDKACLWMTRGHCDRPEDKRLSSRFRIGSALLHPAARARINPCHLAILCSHSLPWDCFASNRNPPWRQTGECSHVCSLFQRLIEKPSCVPDRRVMQVGNSSSVFDGDVWVWFSGLLRRVGAEGRDRGDLIKLPLNIATTKMKSSMMQTDGSPRSNNFPSTTGFEVCDFRLHDNDSLDL